jgi:acyl carrier protein
VTERVQDIALEALEPTILQVMRRVLDDPALAAGDDFFAAGGDSLLAVDVMDELEDATGIPIPTITLFESPTAEEFAQALVELAASGDAAR